MAIQDFWLNVTAALPYFDSRLATEPSNLDPKQLNRRLRDAILWLSPATVDGFAANDFGFMAQTERDALKASVEDFRRVAETVPDDGPATEEQIREALPRFQRILDILQPHENPDVEAFRASKVLAKLRFPNVQKLIHLFDTDSTGDPGIWVWVILNDEVAERPTFYEETQQIRDRIELALRRTGLRRFPYIHFQTVSEQREIDDGVRK
jgi:hypothetical protein